MGQHVAGITNWNYIQPMFPSISIGVMIMNGFVFFTDGTNEGFDWRNPAMPHRAIDRILGLQSIRLFLIKLDFTYLVNSLSFLCLSIFLALLDTVIFISHIRFVIPSLHTFFARILMAILRSALKLKFVDRLCFPACSTSFINHLESPIKIPAASWVKHETTGTFDFNIKRLLDPAHLYNQNYNISKVIL